MNFCIKTLCVIILSTGCIYSNASKDLPLNDNYNSLNNVNLNNVNQEVNINQNNLEPVININQVDINQNNSESVISIPLARYSNIPTIQITQYELGYYGIFDYLHNNNAINDEQLSDYYINIMHILANSLIKLNIDIDNNNITQQRIRTLRSYFGEILDYVVTEAWRPYFHSTNVTKANTIENFRFFYYQLLDNNQSMTNNEIEQMYNTFIYILAQ